MEKFFVDDLIENPTPRLPVALILDTSSSMFGAPIAELNDGVNLFIEAVRNDDTAKYSAEIAIITFGDLVRVVQDFTTVDQIEPKNLFADGLTPMGQAVEKGVELLENRKKLYREVGVDYYQPWMVLMTDGQPTDYIEGAVQKVQTLLANKKLVIFPIAIGPHADLMTLARFTTKNRPPLRLKGLKFREFFEWLSQSVSRVSRSMPGEKVKLPTNIGDWAEIDL